MTREIYGKDENGETFLIRTETVPDPVEAPVVDLSTLTQEQIDILKLALSKL